MRTLAVRLTPGTDLLVELQRLTQAHDLRAGCIVTCVGSLTHARLRMPGALGGPEAFRTWTEPMEILSLSGTLCPDGLHLHIALARRNGACIGGHLAQGCLIHTTAELVIGELAEVAFCRPVDPATGYDELSVGVRGTKS